MSPVRWNLLRFAILVVAIDLGGLAAWRVLPPESGIRTGILVGTLLIGPLVGFLVVYAPTVSQAGE